MDEEHKGQITTDQQRPNLFLDPLFLSILDSPSLFLSLSYYANAQIPRTCIMVVVVVKAWNFNFNVKEKLCIK